jgi:glycerol-3-phosphate acyltransferase PlsY
VSDLALALAIVAAGYLAGAIPFGLIVGRLSGVDPRRVGSGRTGATNVLRSAGPASAAAVLLLDLLKGVAPVLVARVLVPGAAGEWTAAAAAVAAVIGHVRSVFIGFRGGRGVATAGGGLLAISPLAALALAFVVGAVIWRWRFVSLGSISGALLAPVATAALLVAGAGSIAAVAYAAVAGLLVTWAHADNIERLRTGTERRLGERELTTDG